MKGLIEKSLKRYLKRRKRITFGFIISFLITGGVSYSEAIEIKYENGKVTATSGTVVKEENGNFIWSSTEDIEGIKIDKSVIDSNIIVSINNNNKINSNNYGILSSGGNFDVSDVSKSYTLNSIIGNITNTEEISVANTSGDSYGIVNAGGIITQIPSSRTVKLNITSMMGNVINSGDIKVSTENGDSYGIAVKDYIKDSSTSESSFYFSVDSYNIKMDDIINSGTISASATKDTTSNKKGNAYGIFSNGRIGNIKNSGSIIGTGENGYGISSAGAYSYIESIYNDKEAIIKGEGNSSGYGISLSSSENYLGKVTNYGEIYGKINGISLAGGKVTFNELINSGTIKGVTGYGIKISSPEITILKIDNANEILGIGSGIFLTGGKVVIQELKNSGNIEGNSTINGISAGMDTFGNSENKIGKITNSGKISGNTDSGTAYGIRVLNISGIDNNSIIKGEGSNGAYGIYVETGSGSITSSTTFDLGKINNKGTISGNTTSNKAVGIEINTRTPYSSTIESKSNLELIKNENIISGTSTNGTGYGISLQWGKTLIEKIENSGEISGDGANGGYGIYSTYGTTLGDITNSNLIKGTSTSNGGIGVYFIIAGNIINESKGSISGTGRNSGYGIYGLVGSKLGDIKNEGEIKGVATAGKGAGIYGDSGGNIIGDITNGKSGSISGIGVTDGYGIYGSAGSIIGNIINDGEIKGSATAGKGTAIYFQNGGTIGSNEQYSIVNNGSLLGTGTTDGYVIYGSNSSTTKIGGILNNNIILGSATGEGAVISLASSGSVEVGEIANNGTMSGIGTSKAYVFKLESSGTQKIGNITNKGILSGESSSGDGYAIYNSNGGTAEVGKIVNEGIISGIGANNGEAIAFISTSQPEIGKGGGILNTGIILGKGGNKGSGISIEYGDFSKINTVNNIGLILGESTDINLGKGYGISNIGSGSKIDTVTNNGTILGKGSDGGKGINLENTTGIEFSLGGINNNGIISGEVTKNSGYGVYVKDNVKVSTVNVGNISNGGIILGRGKTNGYGFSLQSKTSNFTGIENNGIILGEGSLLGYGIEIEGAMVNLPKLINSGKILGKADEGDGYGISLNVILKGDTIISELNNEGSILGEASTGNGYGISMKNGNYKLSNLINNGTISGKGNKDGYAIYNLDSNFSQGSFNIDEIKTTTISNIENNGVIFGSTSAFYNKNSNFEIEGIVNNGVIYGNKYAIYNDNTDTKEAKINLTSIINTGIIGGTTGIKNFKEELEIQNKGLLITGYGTDEIKIEGSFEPINLESENKLVINGIDKENKARAILSSEINEKENLIINVVGNDENSVIVDNGEILLLSNSTINSIGTAVQVKDGTFTANNLVINSGSYEKAIVGTDINLKNGTVVNGGISSIGNLTIDDSVKLNGKLDGNSSANLLFESSVAQDTRAISGNNINIYQDISNFTSTTIGTNVTLYETVDAQLGDIVIKKGANLVLRVKPTGTTGGVTRATDSTLQVYSTHALMNNSGTISSEGGKLLFDLNGLGIGTVLDFGSNNKLDETMKGKETQYEDDVTIDTTSSLFTIQLGADGKPVVHPVKDLPLKPPVIDIPSEINPGEDITFPEEGENPVIDGIEYSKLNSIYQSMTSTDETKYFDVSDDKKLEGFIKYLADVYRANPYSYSSELSRKSMDMLKNSVLGRELRPDIHKWAVYGGLTHVDGGTKDKYYGRNYYSFDAGKSSVESDMKLTGAYAQAEYGLSLDNTVGIVLGGTNSEAKISSSKLDGDSIYLGVYGKRYIDNMRIALGVGYQYGDYEGNRVTKDYSNIFYDKTNAQSYSGNYNDNGINIYTDIRYTHKIKDNLYFEPYFNVGYTFIKQDKIREEGVLSLDTKEKEFNYLTAKVGGDLKREVLGSKGKHILKAGVDYENIVSGSEATELKSSYKGGKEFGVLVAEKNNDIITTHIKYEYEHQNGTLMDIVSSYSFARENMKNEWKIGAGIGYKF